MGTRADFYIGRGAAAEWLGSIAYDGHPYPENAGDAILHAATETEFRAAAAARIAAGDDGTTPDMGWPWPWTDSRTTDYAYAWDAGYTRASAFGHQWFRPAFEAESDKDDSNKVAVFPDMSGIQRVAWDRRSGVSVVSIPPDP